MLATRSSDRVAKSTLRLKEFRCDKSSQRVAAFLYFGSEESHDANRVAVRVKPLKVRKQNSRQVSIEGDELGYRGHEFPLRSRGSARKSQEVLRNYETK